MGAAPDEADRLRIASARLRRLLAEHSSPIPVLGWDKSAAAPATKSMAETSIQDRAAQRTARSRSLFKVREDVCAVRQGKPGGRSGYAPKADRDWKAYLAAMESDRKTVDREFRTFRPLTDDVVRGHVLGKQTAGACPLLLDEPCWLLAGGWRYGRLAAGRCGVS